MPFRDGPANVESDGNCRDAAAQ